MALARVKNWVAGEVLTASDLNGEFNNVLNNPIALISPLTSALDYNNTQLVNARLEVKTATAAVSGAGRIYWQSTEGAIHVDTGTFMARTPAIVDIQQGFLLGTLNPTAVSGATVYGLVQLGSGLTLTGNVLTVAGLADQFTGLTLTRTSATALAVAIGGCASDDTVLANRILMSVTSAIQGNTAGTWVVGTSQNKLDAGTIGTSQTWHVYVIDRPDTGVVDIAFSLSATTVTVGGAIPAAYTKQRRIGAFRVDGAGAILAFTQDGDYFRWSAAPTLDVNTTAPGASAITAMLTVPTGIAVQALVNAELVIAGTAGMLYLSDLAATDEAASATAAPLGQVSANVANQIAAAPCQIRTNTSGQIRYRVSASDGSTIVRISTLGWIDRRGRG